MLVELKVSLSLHIFIYITDMRYAYCGFNIIITAVCLVLVGLAKRLSPDIFFAKF